MTVTFQLPMHPWSAQATIHVIVEVCCETETLVRLSERVILSALEHDVVLIKRKRINTTTLDHVASADDAYKETDRHTGSDC